MAAFPFGFFSGDVSFDLEAATALRPRPRPRVALGGLCSSFTFLPLPLPLPFPLLVVLFSDFVSDVAALVLLVLPYDTD